MTKTQTKQLKILMVGPGRGKPGGILALTDALVPILEQEVDLLYFPTVQRFSNSEMGQFSLRNIKRAFDQYVRFAQSLYRFRPQLVHVHTSQGMGWLKDTFYIAVSKLFGRRLVLHVHAAEYDELYGRKSRQWQIYTRYMMNRAEAVIAVSTEWKKALGQLVPLDNIHPFRPCLDVTTFPDKTLNTSDETINVLFLGTVGARKGVFDLIEAMRCFPADTPLRLWIAGGGEKEGDLDKARSRIEELQLGDRCELFGIVQGSRKSELLTQAHIFTLPSYNEGLPFAIIEAMAAGLAIVATPVGGIPEVIQDGINGFLVSPGRPEALAGCLLRLANDATRRHKMSRQNREIACRELDVRPYTQRLVALYTAVITGKNANHPMSQTLTTDLQPVFSEEE
ncbi:MAG: glycosyltransferase family 4 protein [Chloroflexi bacterium]|nr:glycosyltransferase family 4 protein [Chloroflexota bacterium]